MEVVPFMLGGFVVWMLLEKWRKPHILTSYRFGDQTCSPHPSHFITYLFMALSILGMLLAAAATTSHAGPLLLLIWPAWIGWHAMRLLWAWVRGETINV